MQRVGCSGISISFTTPTSLSSITDFTIYFVLLSLSLVLLASHTQQVAVRKIKDYCTKIDWLTTLLYLPDPETVLVVNGNQLLSKWKQTDDITLFTNVGVDLLTSLEGLDHAAIRSKHYLSLNCQTLQWLRLLGAWIWTQNMAWQEVNGCNGCWSYNYLYCVR